MLYRHAQQPICVRRSGQRVAAQPGFRRPRRRRPLSAHPAQRRQILERLQQLHLLAQRRRRLHPQLRERRADDRPGPADRPLLPRQPADPRLRHSRRRPARPARALSVERDDRPASIRNVAPDQRSAARSPTTRSAAALIISPAPSSRSRWARRSASWACGRRSSSMSAPCWASARRSLHRHRSEQRRSRRIECTDTPRRGHTLRSAGDCPTGETLTRGAIPPFREAFLGDTPSPRLSVGFGVNWNSPFGPFRIDIARALLIRAGRRHQALHLQRRNRILMNRLALAAAAAALAFVPMAAQARSSLRPRDRRRRCRPRSIADLHRLRRRQDPAPGAGHRSSSSARRQLGAAAADRGAGAPAPRSAALPRASSPTRRCRRRDPGNFQTCAAERRRRELQQGQRARPAQRRFVRSRSASASSRRSSPVMQQRGATIARRARRDAGAQSERSTSPTPCWPSSTRTPPPLNVNAPPPQQQPAAAAGGQPQPQQPRRVRRAANGRRDQRRHRPARHQAGDGGAAASLSDAAGRPGRGARRRPSGSSRSRRSRSTRAFFAGHFPGRPIMPGVLIVEALAQAAGVLAVESLGLAGLGQAGLFHGDRRREVPRAGRAGRAAPARGRVRPEARARVCKFAGRAYVGDKLAAEGRFHGDDRRSAGGLTAGAQPSDPRSIPKTSGELRVAEPFGRRSAPLVHDEHAVGVALGRVEIVDRDQRGALRRRVTSARISSISRIRHSGSRLAVGSSSSSSFGLAAPARGRSAPGRARRSTGVSIRRSSNGVQLQLRQRRHRRRRARSDRARAAARRCRAPPAGR